MFPDILSYNYLIDLYSIIWVLVLLYYSFRVKPVLFMVSWCLAELIIFITSFFHQIIDNQNCGDNVCQIVKDFLIRDFNGQGTLLLRAIGLTITFYVMLKLFKFAEKDLKD